MHIVNNILVGSSLFCIGTPGLQSVKFIHMKQRGAFEFLCTVIGVVRRQSLSGEGLFYCIQIKENIHAGEDDFRKVCRRIFKGYVLSP